MIRHEARQVPSWLIFDVSQKIVGHQIRFFICTEMRASIEAEARKSGAKLMSADPREPRDVEFLESAGVDKEQGRLWTESEDLQYYDALCRAVKRRAYYDRESGLWVKRASRASFETYRVETKKMLSDLVERNRKYAIEVLGGRPVE